MLIDWFTVIAQMINFLILIWLLKHFLYQPILNAMAAREKNIADNIAAASDAKSQADAKKIELEEELQSLQAKKEELFAAAKAQAEKEYQTLLKDARQQVQDRQSEWHRTLTMEREAFLTDLQEQIRQELFAIASLLLHDLADAALEERMAASFQRNFSAMEKAEKGRFLAALPQLSQPVLLRSAFELPAALQNRLLQSLRQDIPAAYPIRFEVEPSLLSGIELVIGGEKIAWSLANHLALLQQRMEQIMERTKTDGTGE